MLEIWPGSVPKFGPGKGGKYFGKYLEIFGWVHGPRHLAARVYNAHWQSFIHMALLNKRTYMHTYIIPCKPTPITLSVAELCRNAEA